MVVALLTMLFVAGAAFLSTVSFENRSITASKEAETEERVTDSVFVDVRQVLMQSICGNDGIPFNQDSPSNIGNDVSGEIPGHHPLIASIEPYQKGLNWEFYSSTDLESTLADRPVAYHPTYFPRVAVASTLQDRGLVGLSDEDEFIEQSSHADLNTDGVIVGGEYFRRDADGDGVWDAYQYELTAERLSSSISGDLRDGLRGADHEEITADDVARLFYALRIVPHGAMVNLNQSHATLVENLFSFTTDQTAWTSLQGGYAAESEEKSLRRRFLLPPRETPLTALQDRQSSVGKALYEWFVEDDFEDFQNDLTDARWWPIDTGSNGLDTTDVSHTWVPWMDATGSTYDVRHLLTTVSYDDHLMRIGRASASSATDWIEDILATPNDFAIDEWPTADPQSKVRGRIKLSLPTLVDIYLTQEDDPLNVGGIVAMNNPSGQEHANAQVFVDTIQDAFLLMLRNVPDFDGDKDEDNDDKDARAYAAASLTANLIDFADGGTNDRPTRVEVIDEDGQPVGTNEYVYGIERQPYISEVVVSTLGVVQEHAYAIELFNPYEDRIILKDSYYIAVNGTVLGVLSGAMNSRDAIYIGAEGNALPAPDIRLPSLVIRPDDRVRLLRMENYDGAAPTFIVVDQVVIPSNFPDPGDTVHEASALMQRDTNSHGGWLVTVPLYDTLQSMASVVAHSLSGANPVDLSTSLGIRPVQAEVVNQDHITKAFPTTGMLLMLSRYANMDTIGSIVKPWTANLIVHPTGDTNPEQKIDNGRMPIFDQSQPAVAAAGPVDLNVPWGQLIFDYFTAVPLNNRYLDPVATPFDSGDGDTYGPHLMPTVDQGGMRVHGRVDLNAAPWTVLAGLPMIRSDALPREGVSGSISDKINSFLSLNATAETPIGAELAKSIVAYREARRIAVPGDQTSDFGADRLRVGTGFLTVGELANVRGTGSSDSSLYCIDSGALTDAPPQTEDFVQAAALLVALGDWVTTRSHVFTVYGTIRGSGLKSEVDSKALRFQETLDRLPSMFGGGLPQRIGDAVLGGYTDARRD